MYKKIGTPTQHTDKAFHVKNNSPKVLGGVN